MSMILRESHVRIRGVALSRVAEAKFLGMILDDRLSFISHINLLRNKISKSIGIIYKISSLVPYHVLLKLYFSLIYPYLIYGVTVRGGSGLTNSARVKTLQNRLLRLLPAPDGIDRYKAINYTNFSLLMVSTSISVC